MHFGVTLELAVVLGLVGVQVVEDHEPSISGLCRRLLGWCQRCIVRRDDACADFGSEGSELLGSL